MSTLTAPTVGPQAADKTAPVKKEASPHAGEEARTTAPSLLAVTRIALGWIFLWAFLDKTFGLGFATERGDAWLNGGSPTFGFLNFATEGKVFHDFFAGLAGPAADWLFMLGLAGIGVALLLGVAMRIAAASGALLSILIWAAQLPLENNPFMDNHLIYALVFVALAVSGAGRTWGLGRGWERLPIVQRLPVLK